MADESKKKDTPKTPRKKSKCREIENKKPKICPYHDACPKPVPSTCPKRVQNDDPCAKYKKKNDLRRFSTIFTDRGAPYYDLFRKKPDPVITGTVISKPPEYFCTCTKKRKMTKLEKEEEEKLRKKKTYQLPKYKKWIREDEERHRKEKNKYFFCYKGYLRAKSPTECLRADNSKLAEYISITGGEVVEPEKISITDSMGAPCPQSETKVEVKAPKSKIFINRKKKGGKRKHRSLVDSFDYVYEEKYRRQHKKYQMFRAEDVDSILTPVLSQEGEAEVEAESENEVEEESDIEGEVEGEFEGENESEELVQELSSVKLIEKPVYRATDVAFRGSKVKYDTYDAQSVDEYGEEEEEEEEEEETPSRHSVRSAATEIDSEYKLKDPVDSDYEFVEPLIAKLVQKYKRDSETDLPPKEEREIPRGTLLSHSITKIPTETTCFLYGSQLGTIHQGSLLFSERSRNKQGLANCVVAYVYSFIKAPNRWSPQDIDKILELGDDLYLETVEKLHVHAVERELKPNELQDIVTIEEKKIKYKIHDPDITGVTQSQDPKIFDLLKGLVLFFDRYRAGILQTANSSYLIWKRKHFYVFDPTPRDVNLYIDLNGTAILANFFDLQSVMVMLIERGAIINTPFIISRIAIKKIIKEEDYDQEDGDSLASDSRKDSVYKIITCTKAVVTGTMSVNDKCFEQCQGRQSLCTVILALIYYHITPAAAWHSRTINKFLLIGNQFYMECMKEMTTKEFKLENVPAFFTIGPLTVEMIIYGNQSAGFMFRKNHCYFEEMLENFFTKHTTALIEIDRSCIGIWKQRTYFYTFDPYSRGKDGLRCANGAGCVTMNGDLASVLETVCHNFPQKESIFKIHALKVLKLNRDPECGETRTVDSEVDVTNAIRVGNRRAVHDLKPISVDLTETAVKTMETADMDIGASILEVASGVESLDQKFVKTLPEQCRVEQPQLVLEHPPEVIYDLDSPSLSDTQIVQSKPNPEVEDEGLAKKYLEEIEMEEWKLKKLLEMPGEDDLNEGYLQEMESLYEGGMRGEAEGEDYSRDIGIQKGKDPTIGMETAGIMTDLQGLISPIQRVPLQPTDMSSVLIAKKRALMQAMAQNRRPDVHEIEMTQTEELTRKNNYTILLDCSQILSGTTNIAREVENYESVHPYCCIVAVIMNRKYSLHTWTSDIVDFCVCVGYDVYQAVEVDYFGSFRMIEIPQMTIGKDTYNIVLEHIFDSLLEPTILQSALDKVLLRNYCMGVVATQVYSCAVFIKRGVYYLFDPFGNNKVGLGEGPSNEGVACMFRFRRLKDLVSRFMYNKSQREMCEPTEATSFVISVLKVSNIWPHEDEKKLRRPGYLLDILEKCDGENEGETDPDPCAGIPVRNELGYKNRGEYTTIQGTMGMEDRLDVTGEVKMCHFICICAMLGRVSKPLKEWTTRRVNYIYQTGQNLYSYIDNTQFADKRSIKNLFIDKYLFDIIIRRIHIVNPSLNKNFRSTLSYVLRKQKCVLLQFPNCCFVLYKNKKCYHLFDPYGLYTGVSDQKNKNKNQEGEAEEQVEGEEDEEKDEAEGKACWIRFPSAKKMKKYLDNNAIDKGALYYFFTVNISNMKTADKWKHLDYKFRAEKEKAKKKQKEKKTKMLNENEDWLEAYPIPWSRMVKNLGCGVKRGATTHKWHYWDVEYPNDLFSLVGSLHQTSKGFCRVSRGKQTIANCIVACIMTEMYNFQTWNSSILSGILRTGDKYFNESTKKIKNANYELSIEDFKQELEVFPYKVKVNFAIYCEGTMFVLRPKQLNLAKALKCFFETQENRRGIIVCSREGSKTRFLAFGRVQFGEYFVYDSQTVGPPMFLDKFRSSSYILRCLSLNRLLHVLTLTLRGGDFVIYDIEIVPPCSDEGEGEEGDEEPEEGKEEGEEGNEEDKGGKEEQAEEDKGEEKQQAAEAAPQVPEQAPEQAPAGQAPEQGAEE